MVWDLRAALLKKGEVESARLDAFEFRLRARAMMGLAGRLGLDRGELARAVAVRGDEAILARVAQDHGLTLEAVREAHRAATDEARIAMIAEFGDPTPYKLA